MQKYLKAIGFSKYNNRRKIKELLEFVIASPSRSFSYEINEREHIHSYEKDFGEGIGITVVKIADELGYSEIDSFYPYVRGMNYLYHNELEFEHFSDKEGYACICDENNLGIPLIFHVNNTIEYLKLTNGKYKDDINSMTLSGIATKGVVILPLERDEYQEHIEKKGNEIRNQMIDAAKAGDVEAMEQLTLEDMDTYTLVTSRSKTEDIFTIVSSYFMPYTVECDRYSILGKIIEVSEIKNTVTEEELYYLSLECNSIQIEIVIAKSEITGIPKVGRRFKGYIWLQGEVDCI